MFRTDPGSRAGAWPDREQPATVAADAARPRPRAERRDNGTGSSSLTRRAVTLHPVGAGRVPQYGCFMLDAGLYPDLVEHGGLSRAMESLALATGIDLGQISASSGDTGELTASVSSDRGEVHVYLGADGRWFSISLFEQSHEWASGGSEQLVDVVRVADAWRRGIGVEELRSRFPFMHLNELAVAYERGDPVSAQWALLLDDQDLVGIRPLLLAVSADIRLRSLFPCVTHLTMLRLMKDHRDRAAGEIWITVKPDHLRVGSEGGEESRSVTSIEAAVAAATALV
jgi:hypothetical protein